VVDRWQYRTGARASTESHRLPHATIIAALSDAHGGGDSLWTNCKATTSSGLSAGIEARLCIRHSSAAVNGWMTSHCRLKSLTAGGFEHHPTQDCTSLQRPTISAFIEPARSVPTIPTTPPVSHYWITRHLRHFSHTCIYCLPMRKINKFSCEEVC